MSGRVTLPTLMLTKSGKLDDRGARVVQWIDLQSRKAEGSNPSLDSIREIGVMVAQRIPNPFVRVQIFGLLP